MRVRHHFSPPVVNPCWWQAPAAIERFLASLVEDELLRLRPGAALPVAVQGHAAELDLVADLGADSLELMALTAAIALTLQLPQAAMLDGLLADTRLSAWCALVRAALDASQPHALTFRTSGSAGLPKPCTHALAALWQEVHTLAQLLPGRRRIVSAAPAHHIYGFLFTVLLPQVLAGVEGAHGGIPVLDVRARVAAGVWQDLRAGDLVVGHPAFWQAALGGCRMEAHAVAQAMAPDVTGVTSTAPCPDALADALVDGGLARLVQVYGSSETAGVGWRERAAAPYRLFDYWRQIDDDDTVLERTFSDGTLARLPLQDRLEWRDATSFVPVGRRDAAVQVGGINVFPARVAEVLRRHPDVEDASVRLMRPDEGSRLKAFLVLRGADPARVHDIEQWARTQLGAAERPAAYSSGPALPRQRSGKLADWIIDTDG